MKSTIADHFSFFEKLPKDCEAFRFSRDSLVVYDVVDSVWKCKFHTDDPKEMTEWVNGEGKAFAKVNLLMLSHPKFYGNLGFKKNEMFIVEPTEQFFEDRKREPEVSKALVFYDDYYIKDASYQFKKNLAERLPELDGIL